MNSRKTVLVLFALLVIFQAAVLFVVTPWFQQNYTGYSIDGFQDQYDLIAMNVLEGRGFRVYADTSETLLRMPGYIYYLAGLFFLFGKSLSAVKLTNMLLAFAVAYLIYLLGRRVTKHEGWSIAASAIYLAHPATLAAESRGGVEIFFSFLIVLFVYTLYRALEQDRLKDYMLLGFVLGLTVLTRSTPMVFPAVLFVYLLIRRRSFDVGPVVLRIGVMTLVAFLLVSPWLVRNYQVAGVFAPKETVAGLSAYNGYYLNKHWSSDKSGQKLLKESVEEQDRLATQLGLPHKPGYIQYFYDVRDEVKFNDYLLDRVFAEYRASPLMAVRTATLNFLRFWFHAGVWTATALNVVLTLPLVVLVGFGIHRGIRSRMDIWPIVLVTGTVMLMHLPVLGVARHHVPLIPFLLILAVIPFVQANRSVGMRT